MIEHDFQYTFDWISNWWHLWEKHIPVQPGLNILEIGCFEGRSTVWFLQRYPACHVTCIDTFEGALDHKQLGLDFSGVEERFLHNTEPWEDRVKLRVGKSFEVCAELSGDGFDIILVDGSHVACDVLADAVMSWALLKRGGVLIFDDYGWGLDRHPIETPKPAIDAFLACHFGQYETLERGYQMIIRKRI